MPTHEEMKRFWETDIAPIITPLCSGPYFIPEIGERAELLRTRAYARYGVTAEVTLSDEVLYHDSRISPLGARLLEGKPQIGVFPRDMMIHRRNVGTGPEGYAIFRSSVVIGFLHELDHLALGLADAEAHADDWFKTVNAEQIVWADTCEYTVTPLVEKYHWPLYKSEADMYKAWVACGRRGNSDSWRSFIRKLYRQQKP